MHREDEATKFSSQLVALRDTIGPSLERCRAHLSQSCIGLASGEIYSQCRAGDMRLVILRRAWRWYADRFEQRQHRDANSANQQHADTKRALNAADEMIWNCWDEACRAAEITTGPPPLAYLDTIPAARTVTRTEVPADLQRRSDQMLQAFLTTMPIATIAIPPATVRRPWWLIVLAHEVGHHVQAETTVDDKNPLVEAVTAAVERAGGSCAEQELWGTWAEEIFADAFALVLAGTASIWAVEELEWRPDGRLMESHSNIYPHPLIRLELQRLLASRCRLSAALDGLATGARTEYADDPCMRMAPAVADAVLRVRFGAATLLELAERTPEWQAMAMRWRAELMRTGDVRQDVEHGSARLCVAGGVHAWQHLIATNTMAGRPRLADRITTAASAFYSGGLRAAPSPAPKRVADARDGLMQGLLSLTDELAANGELP